MSHQGERAVQYVSQTHEWHVWTCSQTGQSVGTKERTIGYTVWIQCFINETVPMCQDIRLDQRVPASSNHCGSKKHLTTFEEVGYVVSAKWRQRDLCDPVVLVPANLPAVMSRATTINHVSAYIFTCRELQKTFKAMKPLSYHAYHS